tara:strand:+ start:1963 stop:3345 length:1383 start_codon:yes stop_codon:yes gene_type:complete
MISTKDFQQSSFSVIAMLSSGASILIIYKLVVSSLGLESLGIFSLALSLAVMIKLLDITGSSYCARFIAEENSEAAETICRKAIIIDTAMLITICFYFVVGSISIIFAPTLLHIFYAGVLAEQLERLVPLMIVLLSMNALMETHYASLDGLHKTVTRSVVSIVGNLVCIVLAIWLVPKFGIVGAVFAQISQALVSILLCRVVLVRAISDLGFFPWHFSLFDFNALLKFGSSIHVSTLSGFGFDPLMKILVVHFGGPILLAYYDLSLKTVGLARSAFSAAFIPIYNNFSAFKASDLDINYRYFENISRLNSFLVGLAFSSLAIITPLISLVFLESLDFTFISLACGILIGYAGNALCMPMYLYAQSKKRLFWNNCGQLTIACVSLLVCFLIGLYDRDSVVYSIPIGLLIGSFFGYLGNRKDFVNEYIRVKEFHLNETRFIRAILSVVLTAVIILGINFSLV